VRQDWAFFATSVGPLYSPVTGNADTLENGHVLADFGYLTELQGQNNVDAGLGAIAARVVEFDPTTLEEIWHLSLSTRAEDNDAGWYAYRAHRIPSVYGRVVD
jgi:hypothetical protein